MRAAFVTMLALAAPMLAADPTPPATLMTKPGKLLLSDDLSGPFGKSWTVGKGKWEASDGSIRASEIAADMHGAVARRSLEFTDAIIELSFKFDGARTASLSLNGSKGHINRVMIRPNGFTVQKDDQDGKNGPDKPTVLESKTVTIKPGEWHTIVLELRGPEMLARLDGKETAYGQHEAISKPKANFGLTAAGQTVSYKNLRIWSAEPNPSWDPSTVKSKK